MHRSEISFREHRELGDVAWLRDHDRALELSSRQDKPILLLFQEIPGCWTCVHFGRDVLAHPLMAELISDRFVPLTIFNNRPGNDAALVRHYGERAWSNPVVRLLAPGGAELLSRLSNCYDALGLHDKIVAALGMLDAEIPEYFRLFGRDLLIEHGRSECATYATPCFWSGETSLAQHPAVISTDAGWVEGEEVVRVHFDPQDASREDLNSHAQSEGFDPIESKSFRLDLEPQFYLRKDLARYLPLSAAQRTAINLAVPYRTPIASLLSPQQSAWMAHPKLAQFSDSEAYRRDIRDSWPKMAERFG